MEDTQKTIPAFPANAVRVCVDQSGADFSGRIYNRMSEEPLVFGNCSEMLLRTDDLFDRCGYPQSFQQKRSFVLSEERQNRYARPQVRMENEEILKQRGAFRTFDIVVRSRRRAGWQGSLKALDGETTEYVSAIQLLMKIEEMLKE